jgi:hypothetical protein
MSTSGWTVLALLAAGPGPGPGPRLELEQRDVPRRGAGPLVELRLWLVNDGTAPIEADPPFAVVPEVASSTGTPVVFMDYRNAAGVPAPHVPPAPEEPVRPGERRLLQTFVISRTATGFQIQGPYGGALVAPGRYTVQIRIDFEPVTRAAWVERYAAGARGTPGAIKKRETATQAAERAAAAYAPHWERVASFWRGHLETSRVVHLE